MQIKKIIGSITITALTALTFNAALYAGDTEKNHEVIMIKKKADDGSMTNLEFDSDVSGVFLHELADGESKSITSKNGELVTINRVGDELHILSNGETIVMPYLHDKGDGNIRIMKMHDGQNMDMNFDIDIDIPEGLTISSSRELDEATQETIRAAIANAGIQDEVHFSKGHKSISKMMFLSEDGDITNLMGNLDIDMDGVDVQEFTTEDGKHVKIIKKHVSTEE